MTGDPLDRIEANCRAAFDVGENVIVETASDVLALVQVARAARPVWAKLIDGSYGRAAMIEKSEIDALGAALARLEETPE